MRINSQGLIFRQRGKTFGLSLGLSFVFLGALFNSGAGAVEPGSATEAVKSTIEELFAILSDENLKKPERAEERRKSIAIDFDFTLESQGDRGLGVTASVLCVSF